MLKVLCFKMFQGMVSVSSGDGRWFTVKEEQQALAKEIYTCQELVSVTFDINENDDAIIEVFDAIREKESSNVASFIL